MSWTRLTAVHHIFFFVVYCPKQNNIKESFLQKRARGKSQERDIFSCKHVSQKQTHNDKKKYLPIDIQKYTKHNNNNNNNNIMNIEN